MSATRDTDALHRVLRGEVPAPGAPASRVVELAAAGMRLGDAEAAAYGANTPLGASVLRHALLAAVQRWLIDDACRGARGAVFTLAAAAARTALEGPGGDASARRTLLMSRGVDVPALCTAFLQLLVEATRGTAGIHTCAAPAPGALLYCDATRDPVACRAFTDAWPARVEELKVLLRAAGALHGAR